MTPQRHCAGFAILMAEGKMKRLQPKEWTESELRRLRVLAKKKVSADSVANPSVAMWVR